MPKVKGKSITRNYYLLISVQCKLFMLKLSDEEPHIGWLIIKRNSQVEVDKIKDGDQPGTTQKTPLE